MEYVYNFFGKKLITASLIFFAISGLFVVGAKFSAKQSQATGSSQPEIVSGVNRSTDFQRTRVELTKLTQSENPTAALNFLKSAMSMYPSVSAQCHSLAHEVGRVAFVKYHDFGLAATYADDVCGAGYIHGVIENNLRNSTDIDHDMVSICKSSPSKDFAQKCYHGVGHGLMYFLKNDVKLAIHKCGEYRDNDVKISCSEGVFMENYSSEDKTHTSEYLNPDNPSFPCTQQNLFYKSTCYFYAPIYFLRLFDNDYDRAIIWCRTIENAFTLRCISGVGSRMMKQYIADEPTPVNFCARMNQTEAAACIDGLIGYYLLQTSSTTMALELCANFNKEKMESCNDSVNRRKKFYQR